MYRYYISDQLYVNSKGGYINERFCDRIEKLHEPIETRTGEEIVLDVLSRIKD